MTYVDPPTPILFNPGHGARSGGTIQDQVQAKSAAVLHMALANGKNCIAWPSCDSREYFMTRRKTRSVQNDDDVRE
jgi:hypothetical protein